MNFRFGFALGLVLAGAVEALAGSNTLSSVSVGKVQTAHVNQFYTALNQDFIPRNSLGVVTDLGGDLGSSTYRWDDLFAKKLNIGSSGSVNFIDDNAGNMRFVLSNSEELELSNDKIRLGGSGAYLSKYGTRTLSIRNSSNTGDYPIVVSEQPTSHGLKIVRGSCSALASTVNSGEGFTCTYAAGPPTQYTVTFTNAFATAPTVTFAAEWGGSGDLSPVFDVAPSTTSFGYRVVVTGGGTVARIVHFIAIGERGN